MGCMIYMATQIVIMEQSNSSYTLLLTNSSLTIAILVNSQQVLHITLIATLYRYGCFNRVFQFCIYALLENALIN